MISILSASFSSALSKGGRVGTSAFDCEWNSERTADASKDLMIFFEVLFILTFVVSRPNCFCADY
jgi:hypothetical protein